MPCAAGRSFELLREVTFPGAASRRVFDLSQLIFRNTSVEDAHRNL